jgi:23S rRNA (guanosine2251-2'-O)-methyltransferase
MAEPNIIFGVRPVQEAVQSGQTINRIYVAKESRAPACKGIIDAAKQQSIPFDFVPQAKINDLTGTKEHQGIAAKISPIDYLSLKDFLSTVKETSTVLLLDQLHHPKNLGLIIRSAVGAGTSALVLTERKGALVDESVIRASTGTVFRIPLVKAGNLSQAMQQLKDAGFWIYGLDAQGETSVFDMDWPRRTVLVLGNETKGLRPNIAKNCDALVSIPLANDLESLNAAMAAGIALFQIAHGRG